jgi:hypothetical protein
MARFPSPQCGLQIHGILPPLMHVLVAMTTQFLAQGDAVLPRVDVVPATQQIEATTQSVSSKRRIWEVANALVRSLQMLKLFWRRTVWSAMGLPGSEIKYQAMDASCLGRLTRPQWCEWGIGRELQCGKQEAVHCGSEDSWCLTGLASSLRVSWPCGIPPRTLMRWDVIIPRTTTDVLSTCRRIRSSEAR